MNKRITALLLAILFPITLLFSGCGKRLTEQEYYDELYNNFKEYAAALEEIDTVQADVTSSQEKMLEQTKATEICQRAEKALEKFDKMDPPESFAEKHKTFLSAVEHEKKFVKASQKVLTARTPFEYEQYSTEATMILASVPEEQQFGAVFAELFQEVQSSLNSKQ